MSVNTWRSGPDIYFLICGNNRPAVSNSYYKPCPGCWNVPKYKFRLLLHKIFNPNVRLFYNLSCILWHQKIEEKYCHEPYCSNSRKLEISVNAWFATERKKKVCNMLLCFELSEKYTLCRIDELIYQPNSDCFSTNMWNNFAEFAI